MNVIIKKSKTSHVHFWCDNVWGADADKIPKAYIELLLAKNSQIVILKVGKLPNCHSQKYQIVIRKNTELSFAKIQNCHSQKFRVFFRKNVERIHA